MKELFGAEHANVQPHAGAMTNTAVYLAALEPGDTILSLSLAHGGHLSHGMKINISGRLYSIVHYGVEPDTFQVDYDKVLALAKEHRPKMIVCGGSAYPRTIETDKFRAIADEVGALLLCDMAHYAGLVAAGLASEPGAELRLRHLDDAQDPRRPARRLHPLHGGVGAEGRQGDLPGPPGRAARARDRRQGDRVQDRRDRRVPRVPGPGARERRRARRRASSRAALDVITGGTDTHLLLVDLRKTEWTGADAEDRLHEVGVTVNKNAIPFDERPPAVASGLRVGTPACTMRGFDAEDFREVGRIIVRRARRGRRPRRRSAPARGALRQEPALPGLPRLLHATSRGAPRSATSTIRSSSTSSRSCGSARRARPTSVASSTS